MEENIKKIEEIINWLKDSSYPYDISLTRDDIQSLENLIKGYRELEKDLHEMTISNNHKKENWIHKNCLNDYIPKSKIKEKIEEYKQEMKEIRAKEKGLIWNHRLYKLNYAIEVLQELMEGEIK